MQVRGTRVFKILSFNRSGNYPRKVNQPPPPHKKKPNKQKKKNPNKTKQNPAINDLFYYNSLVLVHCFNRLYTFIFDMLTFFVGFWDATSYLTSPGESSKNCPSLNCRTYLLHTKQNTNSFSVVSLYSLTTNIVNLDVELKNKQFIDVQY